MQGSGMKLGSPSGYACITECRCHLAVANINQSVSQLLKICVLAAATQQYWSQPPDIGTGCRSATLWLAGSRLIRSRHKVALIQPLHCTLDALQKDEEPPSAWPLQCAWHCYAADSCLGAAWQHAEKL